MRRATWWTAALLVTLGFVLGFLALPLGLWAQGGGCWGSICQTAQGQIVLSGSVTANTPIALSTAPGALTFPGDFVLACTRVPTVGPGFGGITLRGRPGSQPGTMKITLIVGTSTSETVLVDNIPGGSC